MGRWVEDTYEDGHKERRYSTFGDDTLSDLGRNAGLAGMILKAGMSFTEKGVSKIKDKVLTDEEKALAAESEPVEKNDGLVMQALKSSGGIGANLADAYSAMHKGDQELKQIGKSLLNRFKK